MGTDRRAQAGGRLRELGGGKPTPRSTAARAAVAAHPLAQPTKRRSGVGAREADRAATAHALGGGASAGASWYLTATRWGGCRPNRKRALSLSTRALIEELERRGIDREDCVERRDLLDALCGEAGRDEAASDSEDELLVQSPVDKMV